MITNIIAIGNSQGIRIPKLLLQESGLDNKVQLQAKKGEIRIVSLPKPKIPKTSLSSLSQKVLAADWNRPEEEQAWASLQ